MFEETLHKLYKQCYNNLKLPESEKLKIIASYLVNKDEDKKLAIEAIKRYISLKIADPDKIVAQDYDSYKKEFFFSYIKSPHNYGEYRLGSQTLYTNHESIKFEKFKLEKLVKALKFSKKIGYLAIEETFQDICKLPLPIELYERVDIKGILDFYSKRANQEKKNLLMNFLFPKTFIKRSISEEIIKNYDLESLGKRKLSKLTKILKIAYRVPFHFLNFLKSTNFNDLSELYREMNEYGKEIIENKFNNEKMSLYADLVFSKLPYSMAWQYLDTNYFIRFQEVLRSKKYLKTMVFDYDDYTVTFSPDAYIQLAAKDIVHSCISLLEPNAYRMLEEMLNPNHVFCVIEKRSEIVGRFRIYKKGRYLGRVSDVYLVGKQSIDSETIEYLVRDYAEKFGLNYVNRDLFVSRLINSSDNILF